MQDFHGGNIVGAIHVPSETFYVDEDVDALVEEFRTYECIVFHCMFSQQRVRFHSTCCCCRRRCFFFPCALHRAQMRKISRKTRTIVLTMSLRAWLFLSFETNETGTVLRCKVCWTHGSVGTCRWTQGVRVEERIFRMDSERSSRSLREHGRFMNGKRSRMHRRCTCKTFVLVRDERKDG